MKNQTNCWRWKNIKSKCRANINHKSKNNMKLWRKIRRKLWKWLSQQKNQSKVVIV